MLGFAPTAVHSTEQRQGDILTDERQHDTTTSRTTSSTTTIINKNNKRRINHCWGKTITATMTRRRSATNHTKNSKQQQPIFLLVLLALIILFTVILPMIIKFNTQQMKFLDSLILSWVQQQDKDVYQNPPSRSTDPHHGSAISMTTSMLRMSSSQKHITSYCSIVQQQLQGNYQHSKKCRLAVAMFVDRQEHMYGVYSVKNQLAKFNVTPTASHIALVRHSLEENFKQILYEWLGMENVIVIDTSYIHDKIVDVGTWKGTFNKLFMFNLTTYDKIIVLDHDILVRTNILHWFDYPAPCATQEQNTLAWNSGAMVIEPDTGLFNKMIMLLPNITRYNKSEKYTTPPLTMGYSDQDFLTAFFVQNHTELARHRCIMPSEAAILSSKLTAHVSFFLQYRDTTIQTIHFTTGKPMRPKTHTRDHFMCKMYREWNESVLGVEKYLDPLPQNYLSECP